MNKYSVGFIGCGNMCSAMLSAALSAGAVSPENVILYDKNPAVRDKFSGCMVAESAVDLVERCDIIFLCVKPQNIEELFTEISAHTDGKSIVSIVAGLSIGIIMTALENVSVIRCMPNTPMQVLSGVSAVSKSDNTSDDVFAVVSAILSSCSRVFEIDESLQNASIPVHGSSPAFIFRLAQDICAGAEKLGFEKNMALEMFCSTLIGSARMMLESGMSPVDLERMVTSPGGTTRAALDVFDACGFDDTVIDAVCACKKRADELGGM